MHRRGTVRAGAVFAKVAIALFLSLIAISGPTHGWTLASPSAVAAPVDDTASDVPPITVSDFYPESNNLSDCVGLLERPGCGSEARGGQGQTLVFIALALGLGVVFWRISRGIRANRADPAMSPVPAEDTHDERDQAATD